MDQPQTLASYLSGLRAEAGMTVEQVCHSTKIQARYIQALEQGRYGDLPSNTHLRAFALAAAKACGGGEAAAAALVEALLHASAPLTPSRGFDSPAPRPSAPAAAPGPEHAAGPGGPLPRLAMEGPALEAPASSLAAASARLRGLPLLALLALLAVAGLLSYGAAWGMDQWRLHRDHAALAAASAPAALPGEAPAALSPTAAAAPVAQAADTAQTAGVIATRLTLRARRPCWLVLEIDGQRLPTVTLKDGDKLNWSVHQRAVLLAGNVGALRVWWNGDNFGYLGELGHRANAIVFEGGHAPRYDKTAALKLPPGVPE
ncbi:MAG TPA: helix-turn-helix domain-containing protein [bacterium]|nr:helix-turn-helix domain-containing protein [bacterium]